jgi:hypothetical protein
MFLRNVVNIRTTKRYIPEDLNMQYYRCDNLKSWAVNKFKGFSSQCLPCRIVECAVEASE